MKVFNDLFIFFRCASSVKHFQIGWDGSQFKFGMGSFSNISEFVEHFENKPLIGGDSGKLCLVIVNRGKWL